jgi:hypothetical protein
MICAWLTFLLGVPVLFIVGLGLTCWVLADRDLARMRDRRMDRGGQQGTEDARSWTIPALFISAIGLLICGTQAPLLSILFRLGNWHGNT